MNTGGMDDRAFGSCFLPGLSEVHPALFDSMAKPMIAHRGQEMVELLKRIDVRLRRLFRTDRHVLIGTCTATAFMEMAVRSAVRRRALCLVGGAYGERFAGIAEAVGKDVVRLNVPLGRTIEPEMLEDALKRTVVDSVTLVHSETSTGALAPLEELAEVVGGFEDIALLVDGVTSVGASQIEVDRWGIDFLLTASYGSLALPPGLAFAVASERIVQRAETVHERGACLDLIAYQEAAESFQPNFTPAIPLLYGLERQLARIDDSGGIEARWDLHAAMRTAVERWVEREGTEIGFGFLPEVGRRSSAVSCLTVPQGQNARLIVKTLEADGFRVGSGYGSLKRATLRIGHMGDHSVAEVEHLVGALGAIVSRPKPE